MVCACLYAGFQWTIRVLVYPQFARVDPRDFPRYERSHQRRVSVAVGPLFVALAGSALAVVAHGPAGVPTLYRLAAVAPVGAVLAITAILAVPLHGRLEAGFDPKVHRRLLAVDSARLVAALFAVGAAIWLLVG